MKSETAHSFIVGQSLSKCCILKQKSCKANAKAENIENTSGFTGIKLKRLSKPRKLCPFYVRIATCVLLTISMLLCDSASQDLVHLHKALCSRHAIQHSSASIARLPQPETITGEHMVKGIQLWCCGGLDLLVKSCRKLIDTGECLPIELCCATGTLSLGKTSSKLVWGPTSDLYS